MRKLALALVLWPLIALANPLSAFIPFYGSDDKLAASATIAATTTSANIALTVSPTFGAPLQVQIANKSGSWATVNFCPTNSCTAVKPVTTSGQYPVAPGTVVVLTVAQSSLYAAVILDTGTGDVVFTRGEGT